MLERTQEQRPHGAPALQGAEHMPRDRRTEDIGGALEHDTDYQGSAGIHAVNQRGPIDPTLMHECVEVHQPHQPVSPGDHRVHRNVDEVVLGIENRELTADDTRGRNPSQERLGRQPESTADIGVLNQIGVKVDRYPAFKTDGQFPDPVRPRPRKLP